MKNILNDRQAMAQRFLYLFYGLVLLVHILVMLGVVPFSWVNGGRSESYAAQLNLSVTSCIIIVLLAAVVWWAIRTTHKKIGAAVLCVLAAWWLFGALLQLFGTSFEKFLMLPLNIFGVAMHCVAAQSVRKKVE